MASRALAEKKCNVPSLTVHHVGRCQPMLVRRTERPVCGNEFAQSATQLLCKASSVFLFCGLCVMFATPTSRYGKGKGMSSGKKFEAGKKLYANMVFHASHDFLAKYPGKSLDLRDWPFLRGLGGKPQQFVSPEALRSQLLYTNTECFPAFSPY